MVVPIITLRQADERLDGEPGDVLQQYAIEHGYEVIVMGNSSAASSDLVRRLLARKPRTGASVPVLAGPATR